MHHLSMAPISITNPTKSLSILLLPLLLFMFSLSQATMHPPLKETKMSLYFQDQAGGPNLTVIPVAGIPGRAWGYTDFGTIMVTDDPLTLALDRNSPEVGRGQGIFATSSLDGSTLHILLHLIFTNKEFNGSTLEIQGASVQFAPVREVAVVAGTGKFRYARGYGTFETMFIDTSTGYSVERFNFTVQYP